MDGDSRFSYGGEPSGSRMDMSMMDQYATIQQRLTLTQPRMATRGVNPLYLTSAIQHELRRSNGHPVWAPSSHPPPQPLSGSLNHASAIDGNSTRLPVLYGFFQHSGVVNALPQQSIPHYIPRFEEGFVPALHHLPTRFEFTPEMESFRSACQGFYSGSSKSTSGFAQSHPSEQGFKTEAQVDSM